MQLEGLVGPPAYVDALRQGRVRAYLAQRHVAFYASIDVAQAPAQVRRPCQSVREPAAGDGPKSTIVVCARDLVRSVRLADGHWLRIWRYHPRG